MVVQGRRLGWEIVMRADLWLRFAAAHTMMLAALMLFHLGALLITDTSIGHVFNLVAETRNRLIGSAVLNLIWFSLAFPASILILVALAKKRKAYLLPWICWAVVHLITSSVNLCVDLIVWIFYDKKLDSLNVFSLIQYAHLPLLGYSLSMGVRKYREEETHLEQQRRSSLVAAYLISTQLRDSISSTAAFSLCSAPTTELPSGPSSKTTTLSSVEVHPAPTHAFIPSPPSSPSHLAMHPPSLLISQL